MKVLHVIDTLGVGGAEQMLVTVLPALRAQGIEADAAVLRGPMTLKPALEAGGVHVQELPGFNKWNLLAGARAVAKSANDGGYDIVHAHLLFPGVYTGFAKILGLTKARTCISYHNEAYAPGCNKPGLGLWLRKRLNAIACRRGMDGRLAVSKACADHYQTHLKPGPIEVIPNPVDVAAIDGAVSGVQRNKRKTLQMLLPGRLVPEKGHAVLIAALKILADEGPDFKVVFAGDGPLKETIIEQIKAAGFSGRAELTGFIAHADLMKMMRRADIVIIPSIFEGFGLTAVEAMLAGTPVIAARTGGLAEIIDHGNSGLLFPSGDEKALAKSIRDLAANAALRKQLAISGRKACENRYALPGIIKKLRAFYAGLVAEKA